MTAQYMQTAQDGFTPFAAERGHRARTLARVEAASGIRGGLAKIAGQNGQYLTGIDPATISKVYNFDWKTGSDATRPRLGAYGAVVDKKFADDANLKVGDRFT